MKHLQLFEGFKKEDYYTKISDSEANGIMVGLISPSFTEKEISDIKNIYSKIVIPKYFGLIYEVRVELKGIGDYRNKNIIDISLHCSKIGYSRPSWETVRSYHNIVKLPDEYYLLGSGGKGKSVKWFKCDQFDGLIECIDDNKMEF